MPTAGSLGGCRILVIEDDFLLARVIRDILEDEGAEVLGPIGALEEAVEFVSARAMMLDRVILDLNLHGVRSYPVADALARRRIPFIFMTGYNKDAVDAAYRAYPRCIKPVTREDLIAALLDSPGSNAAGL